MREFIVEADGGSRGNPGPAGYGAVVRDASTGQTLAEAAEYLGTATNNVAEYRGLVAGLHAAHALDPDARVHVRMDSKLVVEQMSGRWKIKHPDMKPLAMEAARIFPPGRVTYTWMPRAENKHADRLANEAMDAGARGTPSVGRGVVPEPSGPPGDAVAGAARAREALRGVAASAGRVSAAADWRGGVADGQLAWPVDTTSPVGEENDARAARTLTGSASGLAGAISEGAVAPAASGSVPVGDSGAEAVAAAAPQGTSVASTALGSARMGGPGAEAVSVAASRSASVAPVASGPVPVGGPGAGAAAVGVAQGASADSTASGPGAVGGADSGATVVGGGASAVREGREADGCAAGSAGQTGSGGVGAASAQPSPAAPRPGTGDQTSATTAPGWSAAPDLGAPATFVLLRHGETPLTPQKRFSGSGGTDPSLSEVGREQAERVAGALVRRGTVQVVVASPLARTRETAGIVAARLGLEVTVDDGLRETDFGAWEGLTFGEVRERYPDDLNAWLADPTVRPTGDGESFTETAERIETARARLVAAHAGRTVLLVTHVTPIKTLLRLALGAPPESLFRMELSAASLSAVAYYRDGNASVRLFNDTSHLRP
nr:histidine phosphatase family protein [Streptomyces sp. LaPpAH-108]